jgi:hypothetical protein
MYYIKNAPETLPLPEIFENLRFPLPLPEIFENLRFPLPGSSVSPILWYIDSGASRHMSGVRE